MSFPKWLSAGAARGHAGSLGKNTGRSSLPSRRNEGIPLDVGWIAELEISEDLARAKVSALGRGASTSATDEIRALLGVVRCLDLTTLAADDTPARVRTLCSRARAPFAGTPAEAVAGARDVHAAAVCVFDRFVSDAARALRGSDVAIAAVSAGFPRPWPSLPRRLAAVRSAVARGAAEVDLVVTRAHIHDERWEALYDEVRSLRRAAGPAILKTILGTGEIETLTKVARASLVCLMAGADFVKTSTGRERVNATLGAGLAIVEAIRRYSRATGLPASLKASGGIRTTDDALLWHRLAASELGPAFVEPRRFRIGASGLLSELPVSLLERSRAGD